MEGYEAQICALACYYAGVEELPGLPQTLKAAVADYRAGDRVMSAMRLALAFPTQPPNQDMYRKLYMASALLQKGFLQPGDLRGLLICGEDLAKAGFNPDQPRVPAGHSDGGQWTTGDSGTSSVGHVADNNNSESHATNNSSTNPDGGQWTPQFAAIAAWLKNIPFAAAAAWFRNIPHRMAAILLNAPDLKHFEHNIPQDAVKLTAGDGTVFYAPPKADFLNIYYTGTDYYQSFMDALKFIGPYGLYDFQRDRNTLTFINAYTHASNYAVGVYLAGAGFTRVEMITYAGTFAYFESSNAGSPEQKRWWKKGWDDVMNHKGVFAGADYDHYHDNDPD